MTVPFQKTQSIASHKDEELSGTMDVAPRASIQKPLPALINPTLKAKFPEGGMILYRQATEESCSGDLKVLECSSFIVMFPRSQPALLHPPHHAYESLEKDDYLGGGCRQGDRAGTPDDTRIFCCGQGITVDTSAWAPQGRRSFWRCLTNLGQLVIWQWWLAHKWPCKTWRHKSCQRMCGAGTNELSACLADHSQSLYRERVAVQETLSSQKEAAKCHL